MLTSPTPLNTQHDTIFAHDCTCTQLGGDAGDPSQKASWIDIKATTLDDFAAANGLLTPPPPAAGAAAAGAAAAGAAPGRALFLKIDTEGFDPAVLSGARRLLAAQVPAVVLFE